MLVVDRLQYVKWNYDNPMHIKGILPNLTLILFSTVITLISAEVILRMFYPQRLGVWYDTRDGIVIHPPNLKRYATKFRQATQINSLGMRDREHTVAKEKGIFRILVLGDSFMEAFQVNFEESLPRLLGKNLQKVTRFPIEVINASVSGWGTDHQLAYLKRHAIKFEPDLILVAMTLHNDVSDNLAETFHTVVNGKLLAEPVRETPSVEYMIIQIKGSIASHFHLYQLYRKYWHLKDIQNESQLLDSHVIDLISRIDKTQLIKGWELTYQLSRGIQTVGRQIGAETVIFLIPLAMQLSEERLASFLDTHNLSPGEIFFKKPQEMMKGFGKLQGIEVIDLLPHFKKWKEANLKELYLKGDGHWNQYGHRVASESIVQELFLRGLIKPKHK